MCVCVCVRQIAGKGEERNRIIPCCYSLHYSKSTMSESIECNFARCAVRRVMSAKLNKRNQLPRGIMPAVIREYNQYFAEEEDLRVSCSQASKKFPVICKLFANKWNPKELRESYLSEFSSETWSTLTAEEKAKHTLKKCSACKENYPDLSAAFPTPQRKAISKAKKATIKLSKADLSTRGERYYKS